MSVPSRIFQRFVVGTLPAACVATLILSGCGGSPDANQTAGKPSANAEAHDDHGHAHPAEGPHHGHLVELGNEEFHAEVVHEEGGAVSIYILDGSGKNSVPIDSPEVLINMTHDGKAEQFKLAASPETSDPAGKSSRFISQEKHLSEDLDVEGSVAKLVVTINGKQYSGKIEHDHDQAGEKHQH